MAITIDLQGPAVAGTATSPIVGFGGTVGIGNGAVLFLKSGNRGATSVIDDQGNVFTKIVEANFFGAQYAALWLSADSSNATHVTVTFSASTSFTAQAVSVVGNLATNASNGNNGNSVSQQPGAITTSNANTIVFAMTNTTNGPTTPSGFTGSYSDLSTQFAYQVLTATVTGFNPVFTVSPSSPFACVQVAFTSTHTAGVVNVHLSDLMTWTYQFGAEPADVLVWHDGFLYQPPVPVDEPSADTLSWNDMFTIDGNVRDTLTWLSSQFSVIESYGPLADTLTWSDAFGADMNLLGFARYRR